MSVTGPDPADCFEEPYAELSAQRFKERAQLGNGEALAPQLRKHQKFEEIDGRVSTLGVTAALRPARRHVRREQPVRVPPLELACGEARHRRHFPRAVAVFQLRQRWRLLWQDE